MICYAGPLAPWVIGAFIIATFVVFQVFHALWKIEKIS